MGRMRLPPVPFGILMGLIIGSLLACGGAGRPNAVPAAEAPDPGHPDTTSVLTTDIEQAHADAMTAKTPLAKLEAEKREANARATLAEQEATQWHLLSKQKDVQIKAEHDRQEQVYLYWAAGIFLLLAIAAAVVAIWQPIVRRIAGGFAIACLGGASLCVFVAWLVPYLIWIGGGLAVLALGAVLIWWKRDSKGLHQVVEAVGAAKAEVPAFEAAYRNIFSRVIDSDAEAHITKVRASVAGSLAKAKTKLTDAAHRLATKV